MIRKRTTILVRVISEPLKFGIASQINICHNMEASTYEAMMFRITSLYSSK